MIKGVGLMAAIVSGFAAMTGAAMAQDEPNLVEVSAPEYPRGAERRQLEGYVVVRYNVTDTGEVADVEIVEQTPAGIFDRSVLRALEDWRYEAGVAAAGIEKRFDFNTGG